MNQRDTILLGADMRKNRVGLRSIFGQQYHLLEADNSEQALMLLEQNHSCIACVLLDIEKDAPGVLHFFENAKKLGLPRKIPMIAILSRDAIASEEELLNNGADDVAFKPCPASVIRRRVEIIVDLYRHRWNLEELAEKQARILRQSNEKMVNALSNIIENRNLESGQHVQRIRGFIRVLLEDIAENFPEYGLNQARIDMIVSASALHDIGKISVPDAILNKPGALTKEDFEIIQQHTVNGSRMLKQLAGTDDGLFPRYAYNICRHHHERWDGSGYPDGLKGDEIPICAQAAAVADVFDALTAPRVYKEAYSCRKAAEMIMNGECGAFSPRMLDSFYRVLPRLETLAHDYADGAAPERDVPPAEEALPAKKLPSRSALLEAKCFALFHYMDITVLEADLTLGKFRLLYNSNPDYRVTTPDLTFHEFANSFGIEQIHPEDLESYLQEVEHCHNALFTQGQRRHTLHARMFEPSTGAYRLYEFTTFRLESEIPDHRNVLLMCRPAEEKQRREENSLRNAAGEYELCILNDAALTIMGSTAALRSLTGYTDKEIMDLSGGSLLELIRPEERTSALESIRKQLLLSTTAHLRCSIPCKNGKTASLVAEFKLCLGEDGGEYLHGTCLDDSDGHRRYTELKKKLEHYESILEITGDIYFEMDPASNTIFFSGSWEKRFGHKPVKQCTPEGLIGTTHVHPDDLPMLNEIILRLRAGESCAEACVRIANTGGRYQRSRVRAVRIQDGDRILFPGLIMEAD